MGGSFLSQPITTKRTKKYQHRKIRVITCEMQGIFLPTQAGANIWKTLFSFIELVKKSIYSLFLTAMAEWKFPSLVPEKYLKSYNSIRHFKEAIMKQPYFKPFVS
jgi:hypothetical protein